MQFYIFSKKTSYYKNNITDLTLPYNRTQNRISTMQRVIASSYLTSFNSPSTCFIAPILANFPTTFTNELFCPSSLWLITSINALSTSPNTSTVKQRTCSKQFRNLDSETRSENITNTAIT